MDLNQDQMYYAPGPAEIPRYHPKPVNLLIVVPIYNEAPILRNRLELLYGYLNEAINSFLLVLSVDVSRDNSVAIAEEFCSLNKNVEIIVHKERKGRGFAVREAWKKFDAEYYSFLDTDLAMGVDVISGSLSFLDNSKYDVVTASRYCSGAKVERPPLRNAISRIYNYILRLLFDEKLNDHQCGFKTIRNQVKEELLNKTEINSWFWDAELLVKAIKSGFKVAELPVSWVERKYSKTSIRRLVKDIGIHGYGMMRLLKDIKTKNFVSHVVNKDEISTYSRTD